MAMTSQTIARYGDELYDSLIQCAPIDPLTNREPDITIEDAYHIQLRMIQRRLDAGEVVIGKKNRRHQQSGDGYARRQST